MNADISESIKDRELGSQIKFVALYSDQVYYAKMLRPLKRPQAAQIGGAHNFYTR